MNVSLLLESLAREQGCRAALIDVDKGSHRVASFCDLEEEVYQAATILSRAGVRSLDTVLIFMPLKRELISLLLAVFRLGAQALFIDHSYGPKQIWHCLRLAKPKFLIVDRRLQALALAAPFFGIKGVITFTGNEIGGIQAGLHIVKEVKTDTAAAGDIAVVPSEHPALITFTSGSTGMPKGIVRSHGFLTNQARLLQETLPVGRVDLVGNDQHKCDGLGADGINVMTTLPMFILAALASGQTSIIPASHKDKLLHQLKYIAVDRLLCAPHSLQSICKILEDSGIKLPSLREVIVGGGPVFPRLLAQTNAVMPAASVVTVYGSTEAEPICHRTLSDPKPARLINNERGLPLGKPIDQITLCIIDPRALGQKRTITAQQFEAIKLPAFKEGEIVVCGAHVVRGYLGGLGDSETKFEVGGRIFHRTGDAGYQNDQGEVYLTGRVAYAIVNGTNTVYPLAVELLAMDNEGIERCAYLAVGGKTVLALKLKCGHEKTLILTQLGQAFAKTSVVIDRYIVVNDFPVDKRHQSKIVYGKLKRQLRFAS